jgi:hypothetical protein
LRTPFINQSLSVIVVFILAGAPVTVCFRCHYDTHSFGLMNFQSAVLIIAPTRKLEYSPRATCHLRKVNLLNDVKTFITDEERMQPEHLEQFSVAG